MHAKNVLNIRSHRSRQSMDRGQERIYCAKLRISCVLQHTIPSHSGVIIIGGILKPSRRVVKNKDEKHS